MKQSIQNNYILHLLTHAIWLQKKEKKGKKEKEKE